MDALGDPWRVEGLMGNEQLRNCELSYTAMYSVALHSFLFEGNDAGMKHQVEQRKDLRKLQM